MGWTSYHVEKDFMTGKYDKKGELDRVYTWENENKKVYVLKSMMVGNTYYAAVREDNLLTGEYEVWAGIAYVQIDPREYYNFFYKEMDETVFPEAKCPKTILNMLTHTEHKTANEWRQACRKYLEEKKNKTSLSDLPVGTVIEFKWSGEMRKAIKMQPNHQFKRAWWKCVGENKYFKHNHIPKEFAVVA